MRRFLECIFVCLLITACTQQNGYRQQLDRIEAVIEENPDSAWTMLENIPSSQLEEGEDKALYNLLFTEAAYKLYKPLNNDSLISYSVKFYESDNNSKRLATAYYYKGSVVEESGNISEATLYYKKSEELANSGEDELLKAKVYESLRYLNCNTGDFKRALHYSKLFLTSSKRLGNPVYLANAYENMATDHEELGINQSVDKYRDSSLYYVSKCGNMEKARIYSNYANTLIGKNHYQEAKRHLEKAVESHPMANEYIMLGKIAKQEGDTLEARKYWEKAISFGEPRFTIKAYKHLANLDIEQGDYLQAIWMVAKADSVNLTYQEQKKTSELSEIQRRYDNAIGEKVLTERKNLWLTVTVIAMSVLVIALLIIIYFIRKNKEYREIIDHDIEQIYLKECKIKELMSKGDAYGQEVKVLQEELNKQREATALRLGEGKKVYDGILNGEKIVNFTKEREQSFIDYYAFTHGIAFHEILSHYKSLTLRHTTYLVLKDMGREDKEIGELLRVTDSTIRNYRHRIGREGGQ